MERAGNETPNLSLPSIVDYWLYNFFLEVMLYFILKKKIARYLREAVKNYLADFFR